MAQTETRILNEKDVSSMIRRLAYQVYERNIQEKELIIAGIAGNGSAIAGMLADELAGIAGSMKIKTLKVSVVKEKPNPETVKVEPAVDLKDRSILVVDDVLNTGKTFVYALLPFVGKGTKRIQTLVLVDRNHRLYPISADYIGLSLSTTLQEHVEVAIQRKKVVVNLK